MNRWVQEALGALDRVNREHPWSHNDLFTRWVLRRARRVRRDGGHRALDVGCGTGSLATRLGSVMSSVVGLEPDAHTAELARAQLADVPDVEIREASFDGSMADRFDLITFVAVLHHLPLVETLRSARALLAPGGRLVVVGVFRETAADLLWTVPSLLLNPVVGLVKHPRRAHAPPVHMSAPMAPPTETFREVGEAMRSELPGVVIRRALFWRYLATWRAPLGSS